MKINEVDPRNFDSDIDYYNALNAKPKARTPAEPRLSPSQQAADDEDAISQKRQAADKAFTQKRAVKYIDQEGSAPNGQKYNKLYVIQAQDEGTAAHEEYMFDKHEWGAKKVVDVQKEKNSDGSVTHTLYIVDNHKYGMWKPWKEQPKEEGVAEGAGNIGAQIKAVYQKIYDQGDDAIEFAYNDSPIFAQYWDEYEGDLDSIIAEVEPSELQIILDELEAAAEDQGMAEGLSDTQKKIEDTINQLENRLKHAKTPEQWDQIKDRIERLQAGLKRSKQGVAEGSLNEFAPPGSGDGGDDGFSEETLKRLAAQWYNGDEDPRVERTLMAAGWEIGQDEGYDDEPGVFVVQAGDVNGNSYMSWPAHELQQGVAEGEQNPTDVICVDVPLFIRLMEYAREDAQTDMDLHDVAERLTKLSASGETVTMSSYDDIVGSQTEIKEADMDLEQGRKNIISILKAAEQGQDAQIMVGDEPITLEYPEARFVGGRYKSFMKAGRQEEFLRALTNPRAFDRIMAKMRAVLDKQKNFRGSIPGERAVDEGVVDAVKAGAKKAFKALTGPDDEELIQRLEKETGGKRPEKKNNEKVKENFDKALVNASAQLKENEYFCMMDKQVKLIPEGYKRNSQGFLVRK